jgi:hypothetical protein
MGNMGVFTVDGQKPRMAADGRGKQGIRAASLLRGTAGEKLADIDEEDSAQYQRRILTRLLCVR